MTTVERHVLPEMNVATLRPVGALSQEQAPRPRLRQVLVGADLAAVIGGWALALLVAPGVLASGVGDAIVLVLLLSFVTMLGIASQRLYLARVCTIRAVEINRLGKACAPAVVLALILPRLVAIDLPVAFAVVGGAAAFAAAVVARAGYREFLRAHRRHGRFMRSVVVIGNNDEALELVRLLDTHPELGFAVAGIVGQHSDEAGPTVRYLGPVAAAERAVHQAGATGVLMAASALSGAEINHLVRAFGRSGVHVHLSSGVRGISYSRMRSQPLAHEPLFYVEAPKLGPWQFQTKRLLDLVFSSVAFLLFLPVLAAAALLIKLEDRGPVLYRQTRIGKNGAPFQIVKLRTMHVDAEEVQLEVDINEREGGPLFKATSDPRRTRVGTVLERLSLDEAPQLINVLRGEMSLVGPRPALPSEVAMFDEELRSRHSVLPGITGLWQVEARENPSFGAYRRYDLFYIENWTISLDLSILVATAQSVLFRAASLFAPRKETVPMTLVPGYAEPSS